VKCSNHFGAKRHGLLKVNIVLAPKGAIQNFIKNISYDNCMHTPMQLQRRMQAFLAATVNYNRKSFTTSAPDFLKGSLNL
jgi:hypothetical protein